MKAPRRDCLLFLCSHRAPTNPSDLTANTNKVIRSPSSSLSECFYSHWVLSSAFFECSTWARDREPAQHLKVSHTVFWRHVQWCNCNMAYVMKLFVKIIMSFIEWEFSSTTRKPIKLSFRVENLYLLIYIGPVAPSQHSPAKISLSFSTCFAQPSLHHSLLTARWLGGEREGERAQTCWKSSLAVIIVSERNKQFIRAILRRLNNCCQDISNGFLGYHCLCTDEIWFNLFRNGKIP